MDMKTFPNIPAVLAMSLLLAHAEQQSALLAVLDPAVARAVGLSPPDEELVESVRTASRERREVLLRNSIATDSTWPNGTWGNNLWTLSALYLNEKADQANARLLTAAKAYTDTYLSTGSIGSPTPDNPEGAPWTFFSITDYVRTLCLFHSQSPHFPGRLTAETEAAMKEALWLWTSKGSRLEAFSLQRLYWLIGTENHDLNYRPVYYLVTSMLADDPAYRNRMLDDGYTTAEHAAAQTAYFREWPRHRAMAGFWIEIGSNTYQKYSWPALVNLHDLSPDPVIREQFGKLLDLACIEEEQISVRGWRGGGRSRASHDAADFNSYKNLLLLGATGHSSHSRVLETSTYQAPAFAVLLRHRAFPAGEPFVIRNVVPGEVDTTVTPDWVGELNPIRNDSAQANYTYRSPHYLLGSTLTNPQLVYAGISWQNRTCGMLFDDPKSATVSQVHPHYEHPGGGRPQNPTFAVQHKSVLLIQRIARRAVPFGSYNTGKLNMRFTGADLQKTEAGGWIFTTDGKAYVAVRFLDGGHVWNATQTEAFPADYTGDTTDTTRILMHAGDISEGNFEAFRTAVLANPLTVTANDADYRFGSPQQRIQVNRYVADSPQNFVQPRINGVTQQLRPTPDNPLKTFDSPYLSMDYGSNIATAHYPGYEDLVLEFDPHIYQSKGVLIRSSAENYQSSTTVTTNTLSGFTVDAGKGGKLILAASWESANSAISAMWKGTDVFATAVKRAGGRNSAILHLDNPTPGTGSIVVTFDTPTRSRVGAVMALGLESGVHVTSSGGGRVGSLTTISPALLVGAYTNNGGDTITGPFSSLLYNGTSGSSMGNAGFAIEQEPISRTYTWNVTSNSDVHALAAFKPSSGTPPLAGYEAWIAGYAAGVGDRAGFDADPDGDLIPNGIEAWFGTRPDQASQGLVAVGAAGEGRFTFRHPVNLVLPASITVSYEWSADLVEWFPCDGASGPPGGSRVTISAATEAGTTNVTTSTSNSSSNRLFLRAAAFLQ